MNRLSLSQLGFGCYGLGGAYGRQVDAPTATRLIHMAYDLGIRFFDTADNYGAEEVLGKALGSRRTRVVLATKVVAGGNLSREHIVESCQASLRRLATDYLDLYQVHYDDPKTPAAAVVETLETSGPADPPTVWVTCPADAWKNICTGATATVLAESAPPPGQYMEFALQAMTWHRRLQHHRPGHAYGTIPPIRLCPCRHSPPDPLFRRARLAWG